VAAELDGEMLTMFTLLSISETTAKWHVLYSSGHSVKFNMKKILFVVDE